MNKLMLKLHRLLGTVLSIFFLMWFVSGFVMLFHSFPRITSEQKLSALLPLRPLAPEESHKLDSLISLLPTGDIKSLRLQAGAQGDSYSLFAETSDSLIIKNTEEASPLPTGYGEAIAYAQRLMPRAKIKHVDSLHTADTWIPYLGERSISPIYRIYFDDDKATELYYSTSSGEGIQLTDRASRLWAYLGAIPHWIYFYQLRQHRDAWVTTVTVISALGVVMCLTGMVVGIRSYWQTRRSRRGLHSPYKKWDYRWHHILGFAFGFFVTAFIFSGLMSVQRVPEWIVPTKGTLGKDLRKQRLPQDAELWSRLYKQSLSKYGEEGVVRIELKAVGTSTYLRTETRRATYYDREQAVGAPLTSLYIDEEEAKALIKELSPNSPLRISLLEDYDNYYIDRHGKLPLPVYKIEVDDADESSVYLNPKTGEIRYYNSNGRLSRILYQGLHSWVFAPLVSIPWLWWTLIIVLLTAGLVVSLTGTLIGVKYLRRTFRSKAK